ncbi:MAG: Crp/Fnr family transcriptional regulator [Rhodospirillaceae bacterium]|nr:Crp/Fnr family transcriptional regulator [Rhodospirillaceae bacterium]MBT3494845.1 Crp/Fnr family transcriptional regulator [Rhodospirillaceae bacterium]MBT3781876.1 Crp/Fnr family transcriptional regulator [Rhodospirillaceae bacterium]MBT3976495.1 Crp/Fnr family transcriptional regulator [Rhodospirillaceae bacterium]MBT4167627.1 Crp/Fnr family transcriptional regulator [Rhodospirillaceae bacterium]
MSDKPIFKKKKFAANQTIFDERSPAEWVYILSSGAVEIRVGTLSDNPTTLTTIKVGDVFGELALLEGRPHRAEAVATEPTEVLEVPRQEFIDRLNASDPVMKTVVNHLVRRLQEMTDELAEREHAPQGAGTN